MWKRHARYYEECSRNPRNAKLEEDVDRTIACENLPMARVARQRCSSLPSRRESTPKPTPPAPSASSSPSPRAAAPTSSRASLATRLTESLGQNVIVDNRGGGNFIIGTQHRRESARPTATRCSWRRTRRTRSIRGSSATCLTIPIKDFTPIVAVAYVPTVLVVTPAFPAKSVQEFIAHAKAQDGKLTHGSSGTGGTGHLTAELFKTATGIRAIHVPYKSDGPALVDLLGGQLSFMFPEHASVPPYLKAGRLRALAVTSAKRSPALPDTPTLIESGMKVEVTGWYCLLGPAGMPKAIVTRLNDGSEQDPRAAGFPRAPRQVSARPSRRHAGSGHGADPLGHGEVRESDQGFRREAGLRIYSSLICTLRHLIGPPGAFGEGCRTGARTGPA